MTNNIQAFRNLPDIVFVDKNLEGILADMITEYEEAYFVATGTKKKLAQGDPVRIWIYSQALRLYGAYQLIDFSAKQNLLKYASGDYLDHLGARIGVTRKSASFALATVRFTLSAVQASAVPIPEGTRVSSSSNVFYTTIGFAEIPAGGTFADLTVRCTEAGAVGNGFAPGQINILVDPIPYIGSVSNITVSEGGVDIESDQFLTERIFLKPESFSVAGPEGAYVFFTKGYNQAIGDVSVSSPAAGEVDVRFILANGDIPDTTLIQGVKDYLNDKKRRPLTDKVTVGAPSQVPFDIELIYYIGSDDSASVTAIQAAVHQAIEDYKLWQKTKIGRNINPSELIRRIGNAGAKRVEVTSPMFTELSKTEVALESDVNSVYGGLEDE